MHVLIDGNNLLHAAHEAEPEHPVSRQTLCQRLSRWAAIRGRKVRVVFDGDVPLGGLAAQMTAPGLDVLFSGRGVKADWTIAELIQTHTAPRQLLVVSSDREVAKSARRREARTIKSADFWLRMKRESITKRPRQIEPKAKLEGLSAEETSEWLREMGLDEGH